MVLAEYGKYFDVLELPPNASLHEIKRSYGFLKNLYSTDSIATMPMEGELSEEHSEKIIAEVEEAYQKLLELHRGQVNKPTEQRIESVVSEVKTFDGATLKAIREKLGITIDEISYATKIHKLHLQNIEEENFDDLPVYVYTRGFVVAFAKHLSLDPERVTQEYMEKFCAHRESLEECY